MSAERDPIEALIASISDGAPVDWDAANRAAGPAERERLVAVREMSRITEFNRGLQRVAGATPTLERWGELLVLERIGSGARADVFRAWDPALQREVALKLMRAGDRDDALLEEGRAAARVRHPHVVTVHGIDRRDGRVGLWMELVRGATLEHEVRARGALDIAAVRRLAAEIGGALVAVHGAGLLHRDVTPANIVRDHEGRFVLADFGLGVRGDDVATHLGSRAGTPMYMAPELLQGAAPSERSDQYALGLTLWFALAGRHPFDETTLTELVQAAHRGPSPGLRARRAEVPERLAALIERAIAVAPDARFASVRELIEALGDMSAAGAAPGRERFAWTRAIAVALLVLLAAGSWWMLRSPAPARAPATVGPAAPVPTSYAVEASLLRRGASASSPLVSGDRVKPGDRLSLQVRASLPAWVYVLNEDERGARYLLFPQPRFDVQNPLVADSVIILPGPIGGRENAWIVTSAGGRERFLVVVSPEPIAEIEADLASIPPAIPGRPIVYAPVGDAAVERLRGVGGIAELPQGTRPATLSGFDRFRTLAGRESDVHGVWVRQIVLENPGQQKH